MKVSRHAKIIELIAQHDIETQEELVEYLNRSSRVYRRGRYDHVRDQKRTGYGTCDG